MNPIPSHRMETWLPYLMAALLSAVGLAVNSVMLQANSWVTIGSQWLLFFAMLVGIWHANLRWAHWPALWVVLANAASVVMLARFAQYLYPQFHYALLAMRLAMPTLLFAVLQQAFRSIRHSERLERELLQLRAENYRAELDSLRRQLNPHFLFNALTTLHTVIRTDREVAEQYVVSLADVYRGFLEGNEEAKSTLEQEMRFIESYIFLQKIRFEDGLFFEIDLKPESMSFCLPTFALQLLVENCLKHNVVSEERPLRVRIFQRDPATVTVSNNLQARQGPPEGGGMGLDNLRRRYALLGLHDGLAVQAHPDRFEATLKLF